MGELSSCLQLSSKEIQMASFVASGQSVGRGPNLAAGNRVRCSIADSACQGQLPIIIIDTELGSYLRLVVSREARAMVERITSREGTSRLSRLGELTVLVLSAEGSYQGSGI